MAGNLENRLIDPIRYLKAETVDSSGTKRLGISFRLL